MQSAPMAIGEAPVHRPLRRLCAGTAGRNRPEPTTAPTFLRRTLAAGARFGACASGSEGLRARRAAPSCRPEHMDWLLESSTRGGVGAV
jgi:hypothetical protein